MLITAWRYYPLDQFDDLWGIIEELAVAEAVCTVDQVLEELERKQDSIHKWVNSRKKHLVHPLTEETQEICRDILSRNPGFANADSTKPWADPFVIAEAQVIGATVVTQEHARGMNRIPAVCEREGVPCCDMLSFFADVGIRFSATIEQP